MRGEIHSAAGTHAYVGVFVWSAVILHTFHFLIHMNHFHHLVNHEFCTALKPVSLL